MKTTQNTSQGPNEPSIKLDLVEQYQDRKKQKLLDEALKEEEKIPMLHIDGVLMDPKESLHYLRLRLEAYERALAHRREALTICPTCRQRFP